MKGIRFQRTVSLRANVLFRKKACISREGIRAFAAEDAALPHAMAWDQPSLFIDSGQNRKVILLESDAWLLARSEVIPLSLQFQHLG